MEPVLRVAKSFREAAEIDRRDIAALSLEERISLVEAIRRKHFDESGAESRLERVLVCADRHRVRFVLVGGHAVAAHGEPRARAARSGSEPRNAVGVSRRRKCAAPRLCCVRPAALVDFWLWRSQIRVESPAATVRAVMRNVPVTWDVRPFVTRRSGTKVKHCFSFVRAIPPVERDGERAFQLRCKRSGEVSW